MRAAIKPVIESFGKGTIEKKSLPTGVTKKESHFARWQQPGKGLGRLLICGYQRLIGIISDLNFCRPPTGPDGAAIMGTLQKIRFV